MSAPTYVVTTSSGSALTASTTVSLILLAPATNSFRVTELGISFDGSAAAAAIRVDLYRTTTLGSPTGTTATPVAVNNSQASIALSSGLTILTAEPSAVAVLRTWYVSPASGSLIVQFPLGREPDTTHLTSGTQSIGIRVVTPSGVTPHAASYIEFEE
jgi:hypothetical protein